MLVLYRRICVLNARGCLDEATALESGDFAAALETLRLSDEGRLLGEERLQHWPGIERNRVADAQVTAELLAPLLSNFLSRQSPTNAAVEPKIDLGPVSKPSVVASAMAPAPARQTQPAVPPSITDLLDGMLAQDRAESQSRAQRRAS